MDDSRRTFLDDLLATASPSGYETPAQRVWLDYVADFADEVHTDAYGNAVAVHEGTGEGPEFAVAGHADEIGFVVRRITEEGFLRIAPIGGSDRTVSKGQHVTVHTDDGPVQGVVGQTAIHLRDQSEDAYEDLKEQFVDVGAATEAEAEELVDVGDAITFSATPQQLYGTRLSARGMDNRTGIWVAAEALRRAAEADADATVYAVSTVQEEVGLQGAKMVGSEGWNPSGSRTQSGNFDLDLDAVVAVDVTHATDNPDVEETERGPVELGAGPVVTRGSTNHPKLVDLARETAAAEGIDVQLQAAGSSTGTDADAFFTQRGGLPALNVSVPNRYMHTPVEVVDTEDLVAVADLCGAMAARAADTAPFEVDL